MILFTNQLELKLYQEKKRREEEKNDSYNSFCICTKFYQKYKNELLTYNVIFNKYLL